LFVIPLSFIISYLIGSIPTGYWYAKYFYGIDVTLSGSKNIGATNVARVLGNKRHFFIVFLVDFFKSFLTLYVLYKILIISGLFEFVNVDKILFISSAALIVGNSHSIFLQFRGGKGVSTVAGIFAFLFPSLFVIFLAFWISLLFFFKRVFIASIGGIFSTLPLYFLFSEQVDKSTVLFLTFVFVLTLLRHKNNIVEYFAKKSD
jgi:glycerol-3-phosphate acyltransferase PlsY